MKALNVFRDAARKLVLPILVLSSPAAAETAPAPKEGTWIARDFKFHTGETMPELRLHYRTLGAPTGEPIIVLHGTTGSGAGMLSAAYGGQLFGPGQPFDAAR